MVPPRAIRCMTRPLRVSVPDGTYHAVSRGNNKSPLFEDDADCHRFLTLLGRVVERMEWALLAYCLMGNHYHLLVRTPHANLSRGMQQLNSGYAQALHRRRATGGHVFQGRFHGTLIERDSHLLEVVRYIALNPVRAGFVRFPEDWRWSSHEAIVGAARPPGFLARDELLDWFDGSPARYFGFVAAGDPSDEPDYDGAVFGSDRFALGVLPSKRPTAEIARRDWSQARPLLRELMNDGDRGRAIATAYRRYGYTLSAIAFELGVHVSTVSRALRRFEAGDEAA